MQRYSTEPTVASAADTSSNILGVQDSEDLTPPRLAFGSAFEAPPESLYWISDSMMAILFPYSFVMPLVTNIFPPNA